VKSDKHLYSTNIRHHKYEVMLLDELFRLIQNGSRASEISLSKFQAGKKHSIRNGSADAFHLPRQLKTLLPILLGGL